jgi:hypothetical protein
MKRLRQPVKLLSGVIAARWPIGALMVERTVETPWASATFSGARHSIDFAVRRAAPGDDEKLCLARLRCEEFDIPGHLVADIVVTKKTAHRGGLFFTIEALTVEAA